MKLRILLLLILINNSTVISQASWSFHVWFNLANKQGNPLSKEDYIEQKIKLYSARFGMHADSYFTYDTVANLFHFSQHTISTGSNLIFICETDTISIDISTQELYFDTISLKDGYYDLMFWNNDNKKIDCSEKMQIKNREKYPSCCFNKERFESFRVEERELNLHKAFTRKLIKAKAVIEIKLE